MLVGLNVRGIMLFILKNNSYFWFSRLQIISKVSAEFLLVKYMVFSFASKK